MVSEIDTFVPPLQKKEETVERAGQNIFIDIHDLVEYAEHNLTLSGIQRVVGGLLSNVDEWCKTNPQANIVPVVPHYEEFQIFTVDLHLVKVMIELLETPDGRGRDGLDRAIQAIYDSQTYVNPGKGDVFVMAGAFWLCPDFTMMLELRQRGAQFGLFIHDLIQIKNPEYVHREATLAFRKSLIDALTVANFVLTNSQFVAQEVSKFLHEKLNFQIPVRAVVLATELPKSVKIEGKISSDIMKVSHRDYVLCVGTIEVRKNHWYLIKIWERLIRKFGDAVPDLVFVGKWGWDIDALRNYLKRNSLGGRLHIFNKASDVELSHLYKHCMFTTYPSFAEGFGLPVGESLANGKLCIASNATSIPEVGGEFARYFDPHNVESGYQVISDILSNRLELANCTAHILANYKPRTWAEFSIEFFTNVADLAVKQENEKNNSNCILDPKTYYYVGNDDILRMDENKSPLVTFRMGCTDGWHPFEGWGCWASDREARVRFATREKAGAKLCVLLLLHAPPGSKNPSCLVKIGDVETTLKRLTSQAKWFLAEGLVSEDGFIELTLNSIGIFGKPDHRDLFVGIHSLAYCRLDDRPARISFRKKVISSRLGSLPLNRIAVLPFISSRRDELGKVAQQQTRALVEGIITERMVSQPMFFHINQMGESCGPSQISFPSAAVVTCHNENYMTAANCLARDFYHERYLAFCKAISHPHKFHRQLWEYAFIAEHLKQAGVLQPEFKGMSWGSELTPLPSLFAKLGCSIHLAGEKPKYAKEKLDLPAQQAILDQLFDMNICDKEKFTRQVSFSFTDGKLGSASKAYDFCWSLGKLSKLGSIGNGIDYVVESVEKTLKPGGIACHTGEFNLSSNEETISFGENVVFRREDIEKLYVYLEQRGHKVKYFPIEAGTGFIDYLVDIPPYNSEIHLKTRLGKFVVTSFGIVITCGQ